MQANYCWVSDFERRIYDKLLKWYLNIKWRKTKKSNWIAWSGLILSFWVIWFLPNIHHISSLSLTERKPIVLQKTSVFNSSCTINSTNYISVICGVHETVINVQWDSYAALSISIQGHWCRNNKAKFWPCTKLARLRRATKFEVCASSTRREYLSIVLVVNLCIDFVFIYIFLVGVQWGCFIFLRKHLAQVLV